MPGRIAVVVKGYPRLSETFIAQEIRGLELRGLDLLIVSLRHPTDPDTHPIHREIAAPILYLPEYLEDDRPRVRRAWARVRGRPGFAAAWADFRADLARDRTDNRVRRFGQAMAAAAELPADVRLIYVHYLHTPASVGRYAARILGLPWVCSAHAKDIWTTPRWEIAEKLADCDWLTTCTRVGAEYLSGLAPAPDRVSLTYHGLDFARFPAPPAARALRDGTDPADPVRLLSVGRAVAKKGFDDLLAALAALPAGLAWHWTHIGGGALLPDLQR
ncbi:MAG: colanic acid biosynthesis glycosyltransferase WcaL, partial [Alphaproteobacteria bacterium]